MKEALRLLAKQLALLPGFSREMLAPLNELPTQERIIRPGDRLLWPGAKFDGVFLIEAGWMCLHAELEDGNNQVLTFLLPGQFVGLGALAYSKATWSFTAASRSRLLRFDPGALNAVLDQHPELSKLFMWIALTLLGHMGERLTDIGRRPAFERTGRLILELWSRLNDIGLADAHGFELPISQRLMADALGLTEVHLNRTLRHLRDVGLLTVERDGGRRVTILDRDAAVSRMNFDTARFRLPGLH